MARTAARSFHLRGVPRSLHHLGGVLRLTKIWLMLSSREAQIQLLTSWAGILFIVGKIVRFLLFFVFLFAVLSSAESLAGYSREHVIFFFLVFNLVDIIIQFLFRGVYTFRFKVVSGEYDLDLLKPLPSYFRPVFGGADILDFTTLVPLWIFFFWFVLQYRILANFNDLILFFLLLFNALVIGFSFHLFVCTVCLLTTKIDHLIWVYRDLINMARFPTDIYQKGIRYVLTFIIPVVILITVPAKALLGFLTWGWVIFSIAMGIIFLYLSLRFWQFALKQYSSASS